ALQLADKKDPVAFDALVKLLRMSHEPKMQRRVIQALVTLGDPRGPEALLDRLENDPGGTALADDLFQAVGTFRRRESADRLLALMEKSEPWRDKAFATRVKISGYDQPIDDPEDEGPDRRWEEKQFPRHDALLARLLERWFSLRVSHLATGLVQWARWARGQEVDAPLALLANHPDEKVRRDAVEALGWR